MRMHDMLNYHVLPHYVHTCALGQKRLKDSVLSVKEAFWGCFVKGGQQASSLAC